jgi:hypothetical protein
MPLRRVSRQGRPIAMASASDPVQRCGHATSCGQRDILTPPRTPGARWAATNLDISNAAGALEMAESIYAKPSGSVQDLDVFEPK